MTIRAVLIDLSGTLHIERAAIAGAQAALQRLRDAGLKVKYVTVFGVTRWCLGIVAVHSLYLKIITEE